MTTTEEGEYDRNNFKAGKVGETRDIYQDPITKKDFEGKAKLIHLDKDDGKDGQLWTVEFLSDKYRTQRWIR